MQTGPVDPDLAAEYPYLRLLHTVVEGRRTGSPPGVKERLRLLSDRFTGGKAINLRQEPIPWAYRVFFRQIGIDPDQRRTPVEELALERMTDGGFRSHGLPRDALVIATVETGVALMAFDADRVGDGVGLRLSRAGERLGPEGRMLVNAQIIVADEAGPVAVLFGDVAEARAVGGSTERLRIAAIQVKGVPEVSVEEALWTVVETLGRERAGASGSG